MSLAGPGLALTLEDVSARHPQASSGQAAALQSLAEGAIPVERKSHTIEALWFSESAERKIESTFSYVSLPFSAR